MRILLGTHIYPASDDALYRMEQACQSWTRLGDVSLVDLQFADSPGLAHAGFESRHVLEADSRTVSGCQGPRKPLMSELFHHLAAAADASGSAYFGFSNADIHISQDAVDLVRASDCDAVVFTRMDVEAGTGRELGEFFSGQDTLFLKPAFYHRHRHRFRPYVVGEMPWDVIYTSILLTHGRSRLINRGAWTTHVYHDAIWVDSPFRDHAWRLARMDWAYMARWYRYYYGIKALRERGASPAEEEPILEAAFGKPLSVGERVKTLGRCVRDTLAAGRTR